MLVDRILDLLAQRDAVLFIEELADRGPQAALTVRVSVAGGMVGHRPFAFPYEAGPYGSGMPVIASAFVSSASIASASASDNSWSYPARCSRPCTTRCVAWSPSAMPL